MNIFFTNKPLLVTIQTILLIVAIDVLLNPFLPHRKLVTKTQATNTTLLPKPDINKRLAEWRANQTPVDILIIGNSRAREGLPKSLVEEKLRQHGKDLNVLNLAMTGGTFEGTEAFMRFNVFDHLNGKRIPKLVIYGYSLYEFNDNFFNRSIARYVENQDLFLSIAKHGLRSLERQIVLLRLQHILEASNLYYLQQNDLASALLRRLQQKLDRNSTNSGHAKSQKYRFQPLENFSAGGRQLEALFDLIESFNQLKVPVLFVHIPVPSFHSALYTEQITKVTEQLISTAQNCYKNTTWVDRSITFYGLQDSDFIANNDHMNNSTGNDRFTSTFVEQVLLKKLPFYDF